MANTGLRGSQAVDPRDLTGSTARQLTDRKREREEDAKVGVKDVHRARQEGHAAGWDTGWKSGWNGALEAITDLYNADGIKGVEKLLHDLTGGTDDAPEETK